MLRLDKIQHNFFKTIMIDKFFNTIIISIFLYKNKL